MFLELLSLFSHIIEYTLCFIENNSVLMGVIISVIASSLWLRKFLREKQAEAFFGFYAKLSLHLRVLQKKLEEKDLLNITDPEAGNIYSLIYTKDCINDFCPKFAMLSDQELVPFIDIAKEIKRTILDTDSNVYPPKADKKQWYESQYILFSLCDFLESSEYRHMTNRRTSEGETEDKHIVKCKLLVEALNYIQNSIDFLRN